MESICFNISGELFKNSNEGNQYVDLDFMEAFSISHIGLTVVGGPTQHEGSSFIVDGKRLTWNKEGDIIIGG
jgi:hypothetical protein